VLAQHSVALKLRLFEPLVRGRVVRKGFVALGVLVNIRWFGAIKRRLDVNQYPIRSFSINARVTDRSDGTIVAFGVLFSRIDFDSLIEGDRYAKVYSYLSKRAAEIFKSEPSILTGIANDNGVAASQHHFIERKVLEMTAV
jgi:hypothetical protein